MLTKREEAIQELVSANHDYEQVEYFFLELDGIREGGTMNMMLGGQYLRDHHALSTSYARDVLFAWMESLEEDD